MEFGGVRVGREGGIGERVVEVMMIDQRRWAHGARTFVKFVTSIETLLLPRRRSLATIIQGVWLGIHSAIGVIAIYIAPRPAIRMQICLGHSASMIR